MSGEVARREKDDKKSMKEEFSSRTGLYSLGNCLGFKQTNDFFKFPSFSFLSAVLEIVHAVTLEGH